MSRLAIKGALYDCQVWSKKYRELNDTFGKTFLLDELYELMYASNFKKTYRTKPTSNYTRLIKQIINIESNYIFVMLFYIIKAIIQP